MPYRYDQYNITPQSLKKKARQKKPNFRPTLVKKRRKSDHCLNCSATFDKDYNYCPNCGQENNHNRASFSTLVVDFFHNYFSFDSKFSNSLLPFFFQPGYLTKKFVDGKRASFVNPVRLYLIISLIFFFVFSMVSRDVVQQSINDFDEVIEEIPDSSKVVLNNVLSGDLSQLELDSVYNFTSVPKDSTDQNYNFTLRRPDSTNEFLTEANIDLYMHLRDDYSYEVEQVMDTLNTSSLSSFQYNLTKQLIRLDRAEGQIVISHLLKNLPLMMIFLIPLFALLLKLLYLRRNQYYITHLIHALYMHSFAYIMYGFAFVIVMYWIQGENTGSWIIFISLALVTSHSFFSFLNVYGQKWAKTLLKFAFSGFLYGGLLFIAVLVELFLSVITY